MPQYQPQDMDMCRRLADIEIETQTKPGDVGNWSCLAERIHPIPISTSSDDVVVIQQAFHQTRFPCLNFHETNTEPCLRISLRVANFTTI
jgi:hypothetical protein